MFTINGTSSAKGMDRNKRGPTFT